MGVGNQAVLGLKDVSIGAVQNTGFAARKSGRMLAQAQTPPARLDPDHLHFTVGNEIVEQSDGVAATPNTGEKTIRKLSGGLENLAARLLTDDPVKLADHQRVRMRAQYRPE